MQLSRDEFLRVSLAGPNQPKGTAVAQPATSVYGNFAIASSPRAGAILTERDDAALMQEARKVAHMIEEQPDTREDVVASLRARVEAGTYKVTGEAIADMMLRRMMADRVR